MDSAPLALLFPLTRPPASVTLTIESVERPFVMREIEAVLVIVAPDPEPVARDVLALQSLAGSRLVGAREQVLRDRYFDTADRALSRARVALRIRTSEEGTLLGLKGPSSETQAGIVERAELELAWSAAALERIAAELSAAGVRLERPREMPRDPSSAMARMGLDVIQERETRRVTRAVVSGDGARIAVLAVDEVTYHLARRPVRSYQIEVEAAGASAAPAVAEIVAALQARHPDSLERWPYGKLRTGAAIEQAAERLPATPGGRLTAEGYARLRALMDAAEPGAN